MKVLAIGLIALIGLAACTTTTEAEVPTATIAPAIRDEIGTALVIEAPTTTIAPATTTTTEAEVVPFNQQKVSSLARYAADFYRTDTLDVDCESLSKDHAEVDIYFTGNDIAYVTQAIEDRAEKDGCPIR